MDEKKHALNKKLLRYNSFQPLNAHIYAKKAIANMVDKNDKIITEAFEIIYSNPKFRRNYIDYILNYYSDILKIKAVPQEQLIDEETLFLPLENTILIPNNFPAHYIADLLIKQLRFVYWYMAHSILSDVTEPTSYHPYYPLTQKETKKFINCVEEGFNRITNLCSLLKNEFDLINQIDIIKLKTYKEIVLEFARPCHTITAPINENSKIPEFYTVKSIIGKTLDGTKNIIEVEFKDINSAFLQAVIQIINLILIADTKSIQTNLKIDSYLQQFFTKKIIMEIFPELHEYHMQIEEKFQKCCAEAGLEKTPNLSF